MTSVATLQPDPAPILACTISRDVQNFELLIDEMEIELGENWGDLTFDDAAIFLEQPEASVLQFVAIAVNADDEENLAQVISLIKQARARGIKVILIADQVGPGALHQLLRLGAEDFVPYPIPEGALHEAIGRLNKAPVAEPARPAAVASPDEDVESSVLAALGKAPGPTLVPAEPKADPAAAEAKAAIAEAARIEPHAEATPTFKAKGDRNGVILPVHGLAGGCGASTFATNLAWELATSEKTNAPRVALIDLDFQYGSAATYLDLPRKEAVFDLLTDTAHADSDQMLQAMLTFNDKLNVMTAPADMLPLDIVGPEEIGRLLEMAQANFDFVVIDMPKTIVAWTEAVLTRSHVYFALMELDLRSAQNVLRLVRALKAEGLPHEKLRYVLNRAPKFTDLVAKSRVKRMAESLDITMEIQLPDGGVQVTQANDHGLPLSENAAKNPLRREIQKLAKSLVELNKAAEAGKR